MSRRKVERLMNLTIALMAARRPMSVADIGRIVPGYDSDADDAAFRRMFERDKEDLRDIGVPLEVVETADGETGYRIPKGDYALPEIHLAPEEAAAVGLAARLWASAGGAGGLAAASDTALRKIEAAGATSATPPTGLEPRVEAGEPAFDACLAATQEGRALRFPYRTGSSAEILEREVEPWGLVSWRGRWYLVGHDRGRNDTRVFRLSRITGPAVPTGPTGAVRVPPDEDLRARVEAVARQEPTGRAVLQLRAGAAHALRDGGEDAPPADATPGKATRRSPDGWDTVSIPFADLDRLADSVAGYAPDARAAEPPELREAVTGRLRRVLAAHASGGGSR